MSHRPARAALLRLEALESRLVPTVTASYAVTQDWGSGFQGEIRLANSGPAAVSAWHLELDYAANITSVWDGRIVAHTGNHYAIEGASWNTNLPAGGSVTFGFVATPLQAAPKPANYVLNGVALGGGGGGTPALPTLSVQDISVREGNSGTTSADFVVRLSAASATPVTVNFATSDVTAQTGVDYQGTIGTLTFAPGQTSQTVHVLVNGDTTVEPDETFRFTLSAPNGATLAAAQATGTIRNDDTAPPPSGTASVTFAVTSDWGTGYNGEVTIRNPGTSPLTNWSVSFDLVGSTISSLWNGSITGQAGNRITVGPASWNASIAAGGSTSFGFTVSGAARPTNFALNGTGGGGGGGTGGNRAPVAVDDSAYTTPGQAVTVRVLSNDSDPDGDPLSITTVGAAGHGTVTRNADGTLTYAPAAGFTGGDVFSYTISDGKGGTASARVALSVNPPASWSGQFSASYVDATLFPTYDFVAVARNSGVKHFTLAFIVADPQGRPAWGGYSDYAVNAGAFDANMRAQITALRGLGGDVLVSFGGASGSELAQAITDVTALKAAYRQVVDAYGLTKVDFDIEGAASADRASIDRRSQALAGLQADLAAAGRSLDVWLTLPVLPTGLTGDGVYVVQSALRAGVRLAGVNIMAMDYGDSAAPNPSGRMGDYAIQAATSLFTQLRQVYGAGPADAQLWHMVGITPMIGMNDVTTEVFDQQEAAEVLAFARQMGVGRLSLWSINRDQQSPRGVLNYVDLHSSSLLQTPLEFSLLFERLTA